MKQNLTELVFIIDRSGSMAGLEVDTIGGFNGMLQKQKKAEGEVLVTTVLFNHESQTIHDRVEIDKVPLLTENDYCVGGCTALLDAVGETVEHIKNIHKYARAEDVPQHTLFVITTGSLPSNTATQELVVPKSIPIIFPIIVSVFLLLSDFFVLLIFLQIVCQKRKTGEGSDILSQCLSHFLFVLPS